MSLHEQSDAQKSLETVDARGSRGSVLGRLANTRFCG